MSQLSSEVKSLSKVEREKLLQVALFPVVIPIRTSFGNEY